MRERSKVAKVKIEDEEEVEEDEEEVVEEVVHEVEEVDERRSG